MVVSVVLVAGFDSACAQSEAENIARYESSLLQWGATTFTLPAHIEYRLGLDKAGNGEKDAAVAHLERAILLDPQFPDPYFALSWLEFRRFSPSALFHFVSGVRAITRNFHAQRLLAVNFLVIGTLLLVMVSSIVCIAFGIRYLPFVAYRLAEFLSNHFNALAARVAAFLIVLVPFAVFPSFVTGFCLLLIMAWHFMQRREKLTMALLIAPFVVIAIFASYIDRFATLANPNSFVSLASEATSSAGDAKLISRVTNTEAPGLEMEKQNVLGILLLRRGNFDFAASHFLKAIELAPNHPMAYVNLGNVYYIQGSYEKALEGYRKAERLAPDDAVGQHNLAQAYIKTLLLAESSKALNKASKKGIERVKNSYAPESRAATIVYAKTFSPLQLWRIASVEGAHTDVHMLDAILRPVARFGVRTSAILMALALMAVLMIRRVLRQSHLAFQCSNCGELTSEATCNSERGTFICGPCASAIENVSSDKVIEALLRQRRQSIVVRRRRGVRFVTMWLPGIRDIFYGKILRGLLLALLFSFSLIQIWSRGYVIEDWTALVYTTALWKWAVPAAGIVLSYILSLFGRQYLEVRNYRIASFRSGHPSEDTAARKASA